MEIYIAICIDRHIDETVRVFSTLEKAIKYCEEFIGDNTSWIKEYPEHQVLTENMKNSGWIYYREYSCEGEYVRIEKGIIDGGD